MLDQLTQYSGDVSDPFSHLEEVSEILWPRLDNIGLPRKHRDRRREAIGGSDANIIFSGDDARIEDLWLEKRGEKRPDDLSGKLPVMLGLWTEEFNRQWFEHVQQLSVSARGVLLQCPKDHWRRATLDGLVGDGAAIWEAKHTNAFNSDGDVTERYMPQLQHNMAVAGVARAYLSVIYGNHRFQVIEIAADWLYQIELLDAEREFWKCVETGNCPKPVRPPPSPKALGVREVNMECRNEWASAAADWLTNRNASQKFSEATKTIKALVEDDVAMAFGHGIVARRSKSGALTIKEWCA